MRKIISLIASLLLTLIMTLPALAEAEQCNAIPWGEPLSSVEEIKFSHAAGGIRYYNVTKVKACGISKIEDTRVTYGFTQNKLYVTLVEIDKAKDLKKVVSLLIDEYGLPDTKKTDGWDVYRWETDTLKIKLKSQYTTDRIKIGMYYKPLAPASE
ncbi:hypothetical protein [Pseudodesulfovibrio sp. zrk46]|uniref:hypothetical protein n=1 Tax=Pseudodesulfovibrio sp. zrk46 TaxID=2725288 RepID=UPI001FFC507F|nr:hypothetical protein [Pseudodesulfovibrio sp. zrk46]